MNEEGHGGSGFFGALGKDSCGHGCGCSSAQPGSFELYRDASDEYRWRLKARNGRVIATSGEGYVNKADAEHGMNLVKNASSVTEVKDLT
tara:strand:- start:28166 stop:28435 length:270 start_codon:yes stop_codon:yes gene_type:complete